MSEVEWGLVSLEERSRTGVLSRAVVSCDEICASKMRDEGDEGLYL